MADGRMRPGGRGRDGPDWAWNGAIGELLADKADLIVAPLIVSGTRLDALLFTKPFKFQSLSILVRKVSYCTPILQIQVRVRCTCTCTSFELNSTIISRNGPKRNAQTVRKSSLKSFLHPLDSELWLIILVTVLMVGWLVYVFEHYSPFAWGRRPLFLLRAAILALRLLLWGERHLCSGGRGRSRYSRRRNSNSHSAHSRSRSLSRTLLSGTPSAASQRRRSSSKDEETVALNAHASSADCCGLVDEQTHKATGARSRGTEEEAEGESGVSARWLAAAESALRALRVRDAEAERARSLTGRRALDLRNSIWFSWGVILNTGAGEGALPKTQTRKLPLYDTFT